VFFLAQLAVLIQAAASVCVCVWMLTMMAQIITTAHRDL